MPRLSKEDEEKKFEADKADMRKRMAKKKLEKKQASMLKANDGQFLSNKTRAEKLNLVIKQVLDRLIRESGRGFITDVDYHDAESVKRRKAQLSNVKDLIVIARQMGDLVSEVKDEEATEDEEKALSFSNMTLIEDAKKQLNKLGVKADF